MVVIRPSLPDEVVLWMLDECMYSYILRTSYLLTWYLVVLETREDLSFAYFRALEVLIHNPRVYGWLSVLLLGLSLTT